jgi:hypothetical protein
VADDRTPARRGPTDEVRRQRERNARLRAAGGVSVRLRRLVIAMSTLVGVLVLVFVAIALFGDR